MTLEGGSVPGQGLRRREDIYAEINLSERASRDASGSEKTPIPVSQEPQNKP